MMEIKPQQPPKDFIVTDIMKPKLNQRFPPIENTFRDYSRLAHFILSYLINNATNEDKDDNENKSNNKSPIGETTTALLLHEGDYSSTSVQPLINSCAAMTLRLCLAACLSLITKLLVDNKTSVHIK